MKVGLDKIEILAGYLHDAGFIFGDIQYEEKEQKLTVVLNRIYYEEPKKSKFLFFIPVTRFKNISSRIWIDNVLEINYEWENNAFNTPDSFHTLLDINVQNDTFQLITEYTTLNAKLSKFEGIHFEDISEPTKRYITTDFSKPDLSDLDEFKRLKGDQ